MKLTPSNYFSQEANLVYMSNSQYKLFRECEHKAMAHLAGKLEFKPTLSMMQGHYLHAWNEGKLSKFIAEHPELISTRGETKGQLKSEYKTCNAMIERMKSDKLFMQALSGQKEVIFTAEMFGTPWKIYIDSYLKKEKRFGDLKGLRSINDREYNPIFKVHQSPFEKYGYFLQMAIYAEIERLYHKREDYFEPFLAVVTKEPKPDIDIVGFVSDIEPLEEFIRSELLTVEKHMPRILAVKSGKETPGRCGICDYCKETKVLSGTRHYSEFLN